MIKTYKLYSFLFLLSVSTKAQVPLIVWQNTIGGSSKDVLNSIKQCNDGGYILGGYSTSNISGDKTENCQGGIIYGDYWIIKLDTAGNIQWQNTIGGSDEEQLFSVEQTTDGGYILGGISTSNISGDKTENSIGGNNNNDYWIIKLDGSGNIQWQNTIGGSSEEILCSVRQTADGGYVVGGSSISNISGDKIENSWGDYDYWILKLDFAGNILWQNNIGGTGEDNLYTINQTSDGGFILGGASDSDSSGDKTENVLGNCTDYWIVKVDTIGNIQWQNNISTDGCDHLYSIRQTADGGYILGGDSNSNSFGDKTENSQGGYDYWIIKLDTSGNILWQNTIGGSSLDFLYSIEQTSDSKYFLGGNSSSNISSDKTENCIGGADYWIINVDSSGNVSWQNTIGGSLADQLKSAQQTSDKGFILGGYSLSNISGDKTENCLGNYDYWIVKLSPDSILGSMSSNNYSFPFIVYPNPSNSIIIIQSKLPLPDDYKITLSNTLGQIVLASKFVYVNNSYEIKLDISEICNGLYFLTLHSNRTYHTFKIQKL